MRMTKNLMSWKRKMSLELGPYQESGYSPRKKCLDFQESSEEVKDQ